MNNATERGTAELVIHVQTDEGSPHGWIGDPVGTQHPFSGWLGLIRVLEDRIGGPRINSTSTPTGGSSMSATPTTPLAPIALQPGEGESYWFFGQLVTIKAAADTTTGRVGVTDCLGPRGTGSPLHVHRNEDEWFFVIDGELTIWIGGETVVLPAGSFAYGPRDIPHTFSVTSDTAHFLLVVNPGGFESFVRAVGQSASSLTIPPADDSEPSPEQMAALVALAAEYGIEILGPLGIPA
jgi:quercetin dioxygenase-like cupin family protein